MSVDQTTRTEPGTTSTTHVNVLGPLSVVGADGPVDVGGRKPRLLLAMLIANAGDVVTSESLIDGLWGDDPPATARKTLQVHVSNLRRSLGERLAIETTRAGYRISTEGVSIDAVAFESELREAEAMRETEPAEASGLLTHALGRWSGTPYADLNDEPAIGPEATRLGELRVRAIEQRIEADLLVGRHDSIVGELEALTVDHPFHERFRELHMLALYRCGRQADALRAFDRARRVLADDLGLDPGPGLRRLHQQVLEQSAELEPVSRSPSSERTPARPTASVVRPEVGVTIRGYEIRDRLGNRRDATVYRAYQGSVGREVALRHLAPDVADRPDFVKRFDAECRLLAGFEHPHVVRVHDFWREPAGAFVVMQLMRGGTLEHSLERGPWLPHATVRMVDQVADALAYAHRRGVTHGDLRASNVLLDDDANAYVADFVLDRPSDVADDVAALGELACRTLTGLSSDDVPFGRDAVPAAFVDVIRRATDADPAHRYERVDDLARAIRQCFGADVAPGRLLAAGRHVRNPYKGLRAFQESDAADFFGRDDLLVELVSQVARHGLTAVVGPSGSGKSSLVRAGLVPLLRRDGVTAPHGASRDVVVADMFPGAYPFEELASALEQVAVRPGDLLADLGRDDGGLLRVAKRVLPDDDTDLLLVVDQFEEVFATTTDEGVRRRFLDTLRLAAADGDGRVRVVVTLRADFFGHPLGYPEFGALVKESLVAVTLPNDDELAEAIVEPARRVGLEVEPGLVPTILRDVGGEPGGLPMLQYALTELAETRVTDELTIEGYQRTGGVVGAVATRAEQVFAGLAPSVREAAKQIFVRLVSVGDDTEDTRRRVRRTELEGLGVGRAALESVVGAFGAARLLTFDHDPVTRGPTVEVAHEALLREWPRLRDWIDDQRDDLATERRLRSAVAEWRQHDDDPAYLIPAGRLDGYEEWAETSPLPLSDGEREYLDRSRQAVTERESADAKRRRRVLTLVSVLAVFASVAAVVALVQRNRADDRAAEAADLAEQANRSAAEAQTLLRDVERREAEQRAVNLAERAVEQTDWDVGVLMALEANAVLESVGTTDPRVDGALYQTVHAHAFAQRFPIPGLRITPPRVGAEVAGDAVGTLALTPANEPWVRVFDPSSGEQIGEFELDAGATRTVWDASATSLFTGDTSGHLYRWRLPGQLIERWDVGRTSIEPIVATEDSILFLEWNSQNFPTQAELVELDPRTGRVEPWFGVTYAVPSPGASKLIVSTIEGELVVYDVSAREWVGDVPAPSRPFTTPVWSDFIDWFWAWADDDHIGVLAEGRMHLISVDTGDEVGAFVTGVGDIAFAEFSPYDDLVLVGDRDRRLFVLDAGDGSVLADVSGDDGDIGPTQIEWLPGKRFVLTVDEAFVVDLRPRGAVGVPPGEIGQPHMTRPLPTGGLLAADAVGAAVVVDDDGVVAHRYPVDDSAIGPAVVDRTGAWVASPDADGVVVSDVETGAERSRGPAAHVRPLAVSSEGRRVIVASALDPADLQHFVAVVDGETGELVRRLGTRVDATAATMLHDERHALVGVTALRARPDAVPDHFLWLVDTESGEVVREFVMPAGGCVADVAVSSNDRLATVVGCSGSITLLDVDALSGPEPWTATISVTENAGRRGVGVAFAPSDEQLVATFDDGSLTVYGVVPSLLRQWEIDLGDHVGVPTVVGGDVWVGALDGPAEASTTAGVAIRIPLDHDELVALAEAAATRELTDDECRQLLEQTSCSAG